MKIKNIYEPVFNSHLLLIYDCYAIEAENYLNTQNIQVRLQRCTGQTGSYLIREKEFQQSRYYMYIKKGNIKPEIIGHEVSHLCFMSLYDVGVKITNDTDEIFCYYLDWWIKKIYDIL